MAGKLMKAVWYDSYGGGSAGLKVIQSHSKEIGVWIPSPFSFRIYYCSFAFLILMSLNLDVT